jgi:hypothetical protein
MDHGLARGRLTSQMTLEMKASLKYWLEEPCCKRTSRVDNVAEASSKGLRGGGGWPSLLGVLTDEACASDFSRLKIRWPMSAIMALLVRRIRPEGGYTHILPRRAHDEHGSLLSHLIFLPLQAWHARVGPEEMLPWVAVSGTDAADGLGDRGSTRELSCGCCSMAALVLWYDRARCRWLTAKKGGGGDADLKRSLPGTVVSDGSNGFGVRFDDKCNGPRAGIK